MITPASVSSFVTNTVTADEKKRQNIIATRSGVAGTGYRVMDILRVIGGTPVVRVPALSIKSLTVNNAGSGYLDQNNQARGLEIIIGDPSDPGGGAQVDMSKVVFDTNGGLVELPLLSGGRMYSPENPPTITVKGLGKNARVSARFEE